MIQPALSESLIAGSLVPSARPGARPAMVYTAPPAAL